MKRLSLWARNHPRLSWIIIAISHLMLAGIALLLGFLTYAYEINLANEILVVMANVFFAAYFLYPFRDCRKGLFSNSYYKRKTLDFLLVLSATCVVTVGVNNFAFGPNPVSNYHQADAQLIVHRTGQVTTPVTPKSVWKKSLKAWKKNIRADLKALKKELRKKESPSDKGVLKFFLIFFTILLAIGFLALIGALACNLSCSGQEGLAAVVALLGLGAVVWLTVITIKYIVRKVGKNQQ